MKTKITICTPVYVGTGDKKFISEYRYSEQENRFDAYDLSKIFANMSPKQLLNDKFLDSLLNNDSGSGKDDIQSLINNRKLENIEPSYSLRGNYNLTIEDNYPKNDVMVQVKNLDKPIIPGSTLKGAILNCIYYDFVSNHDKELLEYLELSIGKSLPDIDSFVKYVYRDEPGAENIPEFMKLFRSCITCRDINFENLCLLKSMRVNVRTNKDIPVPNLECIDCDQERTGDYFSIDKTKKSTLKKYYDGTEFYKDLAHYLIKKGNNYNNLIKAGKKFFDRMTLEEIKTCNKYIGKSKYTSQTNRDELKKLREENNKEEIINGFYLRIGGHTNYFYKTVSYFVKKNHEEFYKQYFYDLFSPVEKPQKPDEDSMPDTMPATKPEAGNGCTAIEDSMPETMPVTRTLCTDGKNTYYPGIIKVEFIPEPKD